MRKKDRAWVLRKCKGSMSVLMCVVQLSRKIDLILEHLKLEYREIKEHSKLVEKTDG